jgi:hypothetical protein
MDNPFTGNATGMQNTSIDKAIYTMQIILMSKPNLPREKGVCHGATSSECAHKHWKAVRSGKADGTHSRKRLEGSRRAKIDTGEERIYHGSEDECPYRNIQSLIDVAPDGVARDRLVSGKGVGTTGYCSDCAYTREDE